MADQKIDLSPSEALEKFQQILSSKPSWSKLQDSQIIEHLALFTSWQYRALLWRNERNRQEAYLSTALNRSSVLAGAQDAGYTPRLATPSKGQAVFTNKSSSSVVVPAGSVWILPNTMPIQVINNTPIYPAQYAIADIRQAQQKTILATVDVTKPFYEILISKDLTPFIHVLSVMVDTGNGFELWDSAPRLMNTTSNSMVYDVFYTALDQIGIRFGDGTFGMIPPLNSSVKIELTLTEGNVEIAQGQKLTRVSDGTGDPLLAMVDAQTYTAIVGGRALEDTESIRRNALYYPLYDEQLVWADDYRFQIRRIWPETIWVNVWGEQEMERVYGFNLDYVNRIFISAWAPENLTIGTSIIEGLRNKINRRYVFIQPSFIPFTVTLNAVVPRSISLENAIDSIKSTLSNYYGRDSENRRDDVLLKDFYSLINGTGLFSSGGYFTVSLAGTTAGNGLNEIVFLDMDASTWSVLYD